VGHWYAFETISNPKADSLQIIAPLSEVYGRMPVYHICNVFYILFTIACALAKDLKMLIAFRFLAGCWSITPLTIGPGTIADMTTVEKRGTAMSLWALGPLLGPSVGPVVGGYLGSAAGWQWIFWALTIAISITSVGAFFGMRESYAPVLLERKTKRLRKETGNEDLRSKLDLALSPKQHFTRAIVRPTKLMFLSPICALMSLYIAVIYGTLYVLFTTYTFVFRDTYGFSASSVGLMYLGTGVGMMFGLAFLIVTSDRTVKRLTKRHEELYKPEYRLPPLIWSAWVLPAGLFVYGWSVQYKVCRIVWFPVIVKQADQHQIHWIVPLIGTALFGGGQVLNFMTINTYLVDTFTRYAASAVAASTVLRAILGAVLPLVGLPIYNTMGLGWGNSMLAFLGLALYPLAFFFFFYGEKIRTHPKMQVSL
jgi:multidrug resistance protein